jgi:hypothetical protein
MTIYFRDREGKSPTTELRGILAARWMCQHQVYEVKAVRGAPPPCILVKFRKFSTRNSKMQSNRTYIGVIERQ